MLNTSLSGVTTPLILLALSFAQPVWAEASETSPEQQAPAAEQSPVLMVSSAVVDPIFEPLAEGFAEWIRLRASESGVAVVPGWSVRRAAAATIRRT